MPSEERDCAARRERAASAKAGAGAPDPGRGAVTVKINGAERRLAADTTLLAYLTREGYPPERIAVEYNGAILARAAYASTVLRPGDVLEIVRFVGGG